MTAVSRLAAVPWSPPLLRRATTLLLVVVLGVAAAACSGGARPELATDREVTTTTGVTTTTAAAAPPAEVAQAHGSSIDVFADATAETPVQKITAADATSAPGIPIVFLVKSKSSDRLEVYLPVRPNGSSGWVRTTDVTVSTVDYRIEVALAEHRIRVYERNEVIVDEPVGVGTTDRPTPGGVYYLKELLKPPKPNGPYGPYAYGLSGFSTVLTSFNGGAGVIGIHGTNDPASIGLDVSSGCIRLNNDVISRLVDDIGLPLGTPVEILD
jgi:lipoprotein-anchoring transpeptidase ErfK/SrfK